MVVGHLDVIGVMLLPSETDTPLVVDANAPLTRTVATKLFRAVGRRHAQKVECVRRIDGLQLGVGTAMDVRRKTPHASTREQGGGRLVSEALDHLQRIVRITFSVKKLKTLPAPYADDVLYFRDPNWSPVNVRLRTLLGAGPAPSGTDGA